MLIDGLAWLFAAAGCFFMVVGSIGAFRIPDFFSRTHVVGLIDTIAPLFILVALLLQFGWSFKLFAIAALLLFVNPATTHALCRAARDHTHPDGSGGDDN